MLFHLTAYVNVLISLLVRSVIPEGGEEKCVCCTCWKRQERCIVTLVIDRQRPSAPTLTIMQINNGRLPSWGAQIHIHNHANGPNYTSATFPDPSDLNRLLCQCTAATDFVLLVRLWCEIDDTNAALQCCQRSRHSQLALHLFINTELIVSDTPAVKDKPLQSDNALSLNAVTALKVIMLMGLWVLLW